MTKSLASHPLPPVLADGPAGNHVHTVSRIEAEPALEAALLAGAERNDAQERGVHLFLALYAGTILDRMQAAGLGVVRVGSS